MDTANITKPGLAGDTTKSAKNLAQTIAKKIAQEPWEILKQAGEQVAGTEQMQEKGELEQQTTDGSFNQNQEILSQRDKVRSQRLMQALESELDDIKKKKEQERVMKAQEEQMAREQQKNTEPPLIEPAARKGRRLFNFGKKTQVQRQQTQTERPLPPSG